MRNIRVKIRKQRPKFVHVGGRTAEVYRGRTGDGPMQVFVFRGVPAGNVGGMRDALQDILGGEHALILFLDEKARFSLHEEKR